MDILIRRIQNISPVSLITVLKSSALLFQAGASHVYAIEASPEMASVARQIVKDNGLSDVITVIEGFVEDVEIPVRMTKKLSQSVLHTMFDFLTSFRV